MLDTDAVQRYLSKYGFAQIIVDELCFINSKVETQEMLNFLELDILEMVEEYILSFEERSNDSQLIA